MSTPALAPRANALALLQVTARSWGLDGCMRGEGAVLQATGAAVRTTRRPTIIRAVPARRRPAIALDVTAEQWPYWPTYPGLAANWR